MGLTCVILQPSYLPWRGYFHQIQLADVFVFYDDVQYDHHGWRNRNRIKGPGGPIWLTIPVEKKGAHRLQVRTNQIRVCWQRDWPAKHWKALQACYARAPYFDSYKAQLEPFFQIRPPLLADFTVDLTKAIARLLGTRGTRFLRSSELGIEGARTDRLVAILRSLGADRYITGPSARDYLEEEKLRAAGIALQYMSYDYPEYPQLYPPYDPQVSILDLLFMVGPRAPAYIWDRTG